MSSQKLIFNPKIPSKLQKEFQRLLAVVMYEFLSKMEQTSTENMKEYFHLHLHGISTSSANNNIPTTLPHNEISDVSKLFRGIGYYSVLWDVEEVSSFNGGVRSLCKVYQLKKQFIRCAHPLHKVRVGHELHDERILQSSSNAEYKKLGTTTIMGHKNEALENYRLANAFGLEFSGQEPSSVNETFTTQLQNWAIPSGCTVDDLVDYVLGRMWYKEKSYGVCDDLLDTGSDLDGSEIEDTAEDSSFNAKLPITRKNYPKAPDNYFFNGFMCWCAFSPFTCDNNKYSLISPEGEDQSGSDKRSKSRSVKRQKAREAKKARKETENSIAIRSGNLLPHGMSINDTVRAKGVNVKNVEVKQRSQMTLLNSLTRQMEISERMMDKVMDRIIAAGVADNENHLLWTQYYQEKKNFDDFRAQISKLHTTMTSELSTWDNNVIDLTMDTYTSNNIKTPLSKKVFDDLQLATPSSYSNAVVFTDEKGVKYGTCMYGKKCIVATKLTNHVCFVMGCNNWVCDVCNPFESDETFDNSLSDRVCCTCYDKGKALTKNNKNVT